MHHIKKYIFAFASTLRLGQKKNTEFKLLGPSLSIIKPEITAIFSIINRIIGIILILFLICFSFIFSKNWQIFSFYFFTFSLFILFIFLYHILYGRLKLTLYFNKLYLFINRNIKTINNLLYFYIILIIILIISNINIYIYLYAVKYDINLYFFNYSFDLLYYIILFIILYFKYKLLLLLFTINSKIAIYLLQINTRIEIIKYELEIFWNDLVIEFYELYGDRWLNILSESYLFLKENKAKFSIKYLAFCIKRVTYIFIFFYIFCYELKN